MLDRIKYSFLKNHLRKPVYLILFVTSKCNSRCKHCFFYKNLNSSIPDISLNEIDKLSKSLGRLCELDISGGEPFLRDDLYDIYKIFLENNRVETFGIPTNGIMTGKIYSTVSRILKHGGAKHVTVIISLEGPEKIHNETRGIECYQNAIDTYRALIPLKRKYPHFFLRASTTITKKNYTYLETLHIEIKKNMPGLDFHDFEICRGDIPDIDYTAPSAAELRQISRFIFDIWESYKYPRTLLPVKIADNARRILFNSYIKIIDTGEQIWPCVAGKTHCVTNYNGDISFCELMPPVGNIKDDDFLKIWHSQKAKELRKNIGKKKCSCTHSCFQPFNMRFDRSYWIKFLSR